MAGRTTGQKAGAVLTQLTPGKPSPCPCDAVLRICEAASSCCLIIYVTFMPVSGMCLGNRLMNGNREKNYVLEIPGSITDFLVMLPCARSCTCCKR